MLYQFSYLETFNDCSISVPITCNISIQIQKIIAANVSIAVYCHQLYDADHINYINCFKLCMCMSPKLPLPLGGSGYST